MAKEWKWDETAEGALEAFLSSTLRKQAEDKRPEPFADIQAKSSLELTFKAIKRTEEEIGQELTKAHLTEDEYENVQHVFQQQLGEANQILVNKIKTLRFGHLMQLDKQGLSTKKVTDREPRIEYEQIKKALFMIRNIDLDQNEQE
jgi:hypothetical protein